jgi:hypothetical protein
MSFIGECKKNRHFSASAEVARLVCRSQEQSVGDQLLSALHWPPSKVVYSDVGTLSANDPPFVAVLGWRRNGGVPWGQTPMALP